MRCTEKQQTGVRTEDKVNDGPAAGKAHSHDDKDRPGARIQNAHGSVRRASLLAYPPPGGLARRRGGRSTGDIHPGIPVHRPVQERQLAQNLDLQNRHERGAADTGTPPSGTGTAGHPGSGVSSLQADKYVDYSDLEAVKLQKAIHTLPAGQQLVFNLRYYDELSYHDIAEIAGMSAASAKTSYHIAKGKIIKYMNSID